MCRNWLGLSKINDRNLKTCWRCDNASCFKYNNFAQQGQRKLKFKKIELVYLARRMEKCTETKLIPALILEKDAVRSCAVIYGLNVESSDITRAFDFEMSCLQNHRSLKYMLSLFCKTKFYFMVMRKQQCNEFHFHESVPLDSDKERCSKVKQNQIWMYICWVRKHNFFRIKPKIKIKR